jgi:transcriptional regulator with XRE-family HTH domain
VAVTKLRLRRTLLGMQQQTVASSAEVPQGRLSEFELGRKTPNEDTLARLAKALDCEPDEIRGIHDEPD